MSTLTIREVDAVFGRGGVRGVAMVGAWHALQERGWRLRNVGGVSVGGVVAALIAAGYTPGELRTIVGDIDFRALRDRSGVGRVPGVGPLLSLLGQLGLYRGDALLRLFRDLLADRGIRTFGDLAVPGAAPRWPLAVLASDVSRRCIIRLPYDAADYGIEPDRLEVALALRMSVSIPFYFQPIRLSGSLIVDGGLHAGLPLDLFSAPGSARPVIGVQVVPAPAPAAREIRGPARLLLATYATALDACEGRCAPEDALRTIRIDGRGVAGIDFGLCEEKKRVLYEAGVEAARAFLDARRPTPREVAVA